MEIGEDRGPGEKRGKFVPESRRALWNSLALVIQSTYPANLTLRMFGLVPFPNEHARKSEKRGKKEEQRGNYG